ncbi:glycine oxidase ThiO [Saccharopolyspora rhizosphaerae]|uniref:glycine oxidase n=1 Tax=Saccharopolyspora rhizosphaerae TaxID=2492662 RepID=A0A3R8P0J5_9PSEU|nr:glycine oxidase ThiO [Saccharopolyspora rhizosphaerae]RRO17311.1 glycine oxidase ThiO [Saccharopolyspora rhizosphaerae]
MSEERTEHVVVVGGGVVGLSVAWRAAASGYRVSLVDPAPASGASHVAGGMLAPLAEAWPGEEELLELGSASLGRWPEFAEELSQASGSPSGLRTEGTLVIGVDGADREELDNVAGHLARLGRTVTRLTGRELRKLEPALGPSVRGGLEVPGDLAVDNRKALVALRAAAEAAGVEFVAERAEQVRPGAVELAGSTVSCDVVVISAGAHSGSLHPALAQKIRPVKGEILRLRKRATALPPPTRTVRGPVHGRPCYLVPRDDGGVVLGATQHEVGFDTEVTVAGVRDLLADAETVMPGIAEYTLLEATAGLRPSTADNLPVIGWLEPGVLAATGHHRGGFLLTPITADAVLALLRREQPEALIKATDPSRLGGQQ